MSAVKNIIANYNRQSININFKINSSLNISAITGGNGSSKSSILRDIIISLFTHTDDNKKELAGSSSNAHVTFTDPQSTYIVASSGSISDRFPEKIRGGYSTKFTSSNYVYLGQRVGTNLFSKKPLVEFIIKGILQRRISHNRNPILNEIFDAIGLSSELRVVISSKVSSLKKTPREFSILPKNKHQLTLALEGTPQNPEKSHIGTSIGIPSGKNKVLRSSLESLETQSVIQLLKNDPTPKTIFIKVEDGVIKTDEVSNKYIYSIIEGLSENQLQVSSCEVRKNSTQDFYSIYELSSGEYHLMTCMMGIYFSATQKSIVLIDEPENSLHPAWQVLFINLLTKITKHNKVRQLIIGTHSPIIISSLPKNAEVIDLSNPEEGHSFFSKSVDEILLENFNLPTTRNYYFHDELQAAIKNFSNNGQINSTFEHAIKNLIKYRKNLRSTDPAAEMIDFLWNEYNLQK